MVAHLRRQGLQVAHCTFDRLMADLGMDGVVRAKSQRTTVPGRDGRRAGDLVDRDFTAAAPNRLFVADFTYVRSWARFVYVAFAVDAFSQKTVGWHAMPSKHTDLVLTCLRMATWRRAHDGHPVSARLVHRSDAGPQYTSLHFTEHLALEGIGPSIGSVGDAYDTQSMIMSVDVGYLVRRVPRRALEDYLRRGVRHRDLGGVVEHHAPALHPRPRPTGRVRSSQLR
ncbi:Transposase InsO and inactivated derivatives [Modestobacter sp. DSM 44400]|nr:Transposase InsO and inactivated derivatives [Modestobacter sp. DSM 44400]